MKKLSFFVVSLMIASQLAQVLAAPQAPVPPATYAMDGSISYRTIQTNQQARSARNASMTLEIGNANGLFPYLPNTGYSCFNLDGPGPAYAYSFFLDSSSINMSQCVAWNNTEIIRNSTAFIIDPFWDYLTKATPTEIANAMVAK
jgi:hypothetical protein